MNTDKKMTAEEWWIRTASLLSVKMRQGGVKDFRVTLTDRGTYEFEVNPIDPGLNIRVYPCESVVKTLPLLLQPTT
jgi:hypothetical protein